MEWVNAAVIVVYLIALVMFGFWGNLQLGPRQFAVCVQQNYGGAYITVFVASFVGRHCLTQRPFIVTYKTESETKDYGPVYPEQR